LTVSIEGIDLPLALYLKAQAKRCLGNVSVAVTLARIEKGFVTAGSL
jgi:hypothetical protein